MATIDTVSKAGLNDRALNSSLLRSEGLGHVRKIAGKVWTDHNLHDPGVTILELLCFAITDLSYRASLPIEDLLAPGVDSEEACFNSAATVLPAAPTTVKDYRKLLIDVKGVANAWLQEAEIAFMADCAEGTLQPLPSGVLPMRAQRIDVRGVYDVLLALESDTGATAESRDTIIQRVRERLNANRGLCLDFGQIRVIDAQDLMLCAEIDVLPEVDIAALQAEICYRIQRHLAPGVRFQTLQQMKDKGKTVDEIFDGPLLDHGFIDDAELDRSDLKDAIRLSDVIDIVMNISGVRTVRDMILDLPENAQQGVRNWTITRPAGKIPVLKMDTCRIVFYKGSVPLTTDKNAAAQRARQLLAGEQQRNKEPGGLSGQKDIPIPQGKARDVGRYYPVLNDFPAVYGIGKGGLPETASPERKAQARQLKAYLLFAEQIMADYCVQLSGAWKLFSLDPGLKRTYFTQTIGDEVQDIQALYSDYAHLQENLEKMTESHDLFLDRRNRLLDHLLARFAEAFNEYALAQYDLSEFGSVQDKQERIMRDKLQFLAEYPRISGRRGQGTDLSRSSDLWNTTNVSGLEHRVARLVGIDNYSRRDLLALEEETYLERDADHVDELRFRIRDDQGKILLSSSTRYTSKQEALRELKKTIALAMMEEGYDRKETADGRFYFNIVDSKGEVVARRIEYFATAEAREQSIAHLLSFLTTRHGSEEGLFVIEHIHLRPDPAWKDPGANLFLPLCTGRSEDACSDPDPYSFKVSVVVPAWPDRFQDTDFRNFLERTIRVETPSHILPRVCFVDIEQMDRFERAYRTWLAAQAGATEAERKSSLAELIDVLIHLKNVYPRTKLSGCDKDDTYRERFILGRTVLGTTPEE